jgi:hypothetical protein
MRSKKPLITLLRKLIDAVEDEASRNPHFADKLDELMRSFQEAPEMRSKPVPKRMEEVLPDVHKELALRGDRDFRVWLRGQAVETLKAVIRREDLDTARRASKWKDGDKLADFIADGLRARMSRGSAFIERVNRTAPTAPGHVGDGPRDGTSTRAPTDAGSEPQQVSSDHQPPESTGDSRGSAEPPASGEPNEK